MVLAWFSGEGSSHGVCLIINISWWIIAFDLTYFIFVGGGPWGLGGGGGKKERERERRRRKVYIAVVESTYEIFLSIFLCERHFCPDPRLIKLESLALHIMNLHDSYIKSKYYHCSLHNIQRAAYVLICVCFSVLGNFLFVENHYCTTLVQESSYTQNKIWY